MLPRHYRLTCVLEQIYAMNKFVLMFLTFSLYVFLNIYVCIPPPPCPTYMRPEPVVTCLDIKFTSILPFTLLCVCLAVYILSHIDLNCRFISFNTRLNTLKVQAKERSHDKLNFLLLFLSYLLIFEYFFVVFLPFEFWKIDLDLRNITKKAVIVVKLFHGIVASTVSYACIPVGYTTIVCCYHFPFETLAIWFFVIRLLLCPDIHPNPGPAHSTQFAAGFLSFCNWNLNTL